MRRRIGIFSRITKEFGLGYATGYLIRWALRRTVESVSRDYVFMDVVDVDLNKKHGTLEKSIYNSESPLVWFVPAWSNVWGGGHFTIFRFAHLMTKRRENIIFVYDNDGRWPAKYFENSLKVPFKTHKIGVLVDPSKIPVNAIPIATTWQSAYSVLKHMPSARFKFYFMQDYENLFYAHGTQSMQALASYQLGFKAITGGPWLLSKYREHGGSGTNYMFTVDHSIFYPAKRPRSQVKKIFFYGRPSTERRCFELGIAALKLIKQNYPEIEIVIAGLDGIGNVGFEATMVGSVALPKLGELYRSCDIGIALSGTNLSYLPVELMACGVPVVTNNGPQVDWYCEDGVNSLVVPPFPSSILSAVTKLIKDPELSKKLREGGLEKSSSSDWEKEATSIYRYLTTSLKS